jgi:hypothetical protein
MTGEEAYAAWAPPDARWSPWVKPVLFACMTQQGGLAASDLAEEATPWAPRPDSGTAIVLDLPGSRGVTLGVALAALGYQPVPLYNAAPSATGRVAHGSADALVDMREILLALRAAAPRIASARARRSAPPAFLLDDRRRGLAMDPTPGRFDNRSVSFTTDFPSARTLLSSGIRRSLLVQQASDQPQPDLAHTLRAWQEAGISLALCRLDASGEPAPLVVDKPRRFGALCYRASLLFRMRRYPLGGFGGVVPEPIDGGGFAG